MSIPFSGQPIRYSDPETGVTYLLRPFTGETEISLMELATTLPQDKKKRAEFFTPKNLREVSKYTDHQIDTVLCGWESSKRKLPPFPDSRPSQAMKFDLKMQIMAFYHNTDNKELTGEDLKK
jgi:hypothetical protein